MEDDFGSGSFLQGDKDSEIIEMPPVQECMTPTIRKRMDELNLFRLKNDFIMWSMEAHNEQFINDFAKPLTSTIMDTYGIVKCQGGFTDTERKMLDMIWTCKNDNHRQCLWFACLYLVPGLYNWFINPVMKDGRLYPPIANNSIEQFKIWVNDVIKNQINKWLNGVIDDDTFINTIRIGYYTNVGLPIP